ncbi:hypothetical protein HBI56_030960 [Parastagonospora nodorum]|nr:hypothetical protein HBI09_104090 [Parastagonospora nodorum]KAH4910336.1 hypothetical protein HBI80_027560 [Parastagonospora nodorum]KAH4929884.1 hypothetical protein HBH73_193370 [Parastagonospora nodorum]KAH5010198.1 hypothetical protein HBI77_088980 [Parastagonospora nodorum]KAH5083553.1 hypothetical protein HBI73_160580 [Parastagonospora nodorum]
MASNPPRSFFAYPAEIQVKIYAYLLGEVSDKPIPQLLEPYSGIILSCKKSRNDFEHEWAKVFNNFVSRTLGGSDLRAMPVKLFHNAHHVLYLVLNDLFTILPTAMRDALVALPFISPLLILRLDKSFPVCRGNIRDFYLSEQWLASIHLSNGLYVRDHVPTPETYRPYILIGCAESTSRLNSLLPDVPR